MFNIKLRWHEEIRRNGWNLGLDYETQAQKLKRGGRSCGTCYHWEPVVNYKFVGVCRQGCALRRFFRGGPKPDTHWCRKWVPHLARI